MSDTNSNQTLMALLAPEAEESIATDNAAALSDGHGTPQLPTLDQRIDMLLCAVHGLNQPVTPEMRLAARDRGITARLIVRVQSVIVSPRSRGDPLGTVLRSVRLPHICAATSVM